MATEHGF